MRKSKFSEFQVVKIFKSVEGSHAAKDICREHDINSAA